MKSIAAHRNLHCGARQRRQEYHAASRFPIVESGIELKEFEMDWLQISSPAGVLAMLSGVCAFFYWLEKATRWRLFQYLPPVVFIYLVPIILANRHILPTKSPVYDAIQNLLLPMMLTLLLVNVNVKVRVSRYGPRHRRDAFRLVGNYGRCGRGPARCPALVRTGSLEGVWQPVGQLDRRHGQFGRGQKMLDAPAAETGLAVISDSVCSRVAPCFTGVQSIWRSGSIGSSASAGSRRATEYSSSAKGPRERSLFRYTICFIWSLSVSASPGRFDDRRSAAGSAACLDDRDLQNPDRDDPGADREFHAGAPRTGKPRYGHGACLSVHSAHGREGFGRGAGRRGASVRRRGLYRAVHPRRVSSWVRPALPHRHPHGRHRQRGQHRGGRGLCAGSSRRSTTSASCRSPC